MATCRFCQREFVSGQAVRAHLKSCEPYVNHSPRQEPQASSLKAESVREDSLSTPSLGIASREGSEPVPTGEFDPVRQLDQQIAAEQRRLKLRELREAHEDMDRRTLARQQERHRVIEQQEEAARTIERERVSARQREEQARQVRERGADADQQRQRQRRERIQEVKRGVVERWAYGASISSSLKAQVLQEIERALFPLPVDDLPLDELVKIAEGVRDELHGKALRTEQHTQRKAQERAQRRQRLQQHGLDYARRALNDVDSLDVLESWRIEQSVRQELQEEIEGDESNADIEAWVEEILEREGIGYDDDDEEE